MTSFFNESDSELYESHETEAILSDLLNEEQGEEDQKNQKAGKDQLRTLPISRHPLFPKHQIKFRLAEQHFQFLLRDPFTQYIGAFLLKPKKGETSELEDKRKQIAGISPLKSIEDIYHIGAYCKTTFNRLERTILLKPQHKISLKQIFPDDFEDSPPFPLAKIQHLKEEFTDKSSEQVHEDKHMLELLVNKLEELKRFLTMHERQSMEAFSAQYDMRHDNDFLDYVSVSLSYMLDSQKIQNIFEVLDGSERIRLLCEVLDEHVEMRKGMRGMQQEAQAKIQKHSEEVVLKQILKTVQQRLGHDKDEKAQLKQKYKDNLKDKEVPEHIHKIYQEELDRLQTTDQNSSEFQVIRTYLDWLTIMPWGVESDECLDIDQANKILEEDHYGMADIKERILEFIAVTKLKKTVHGKILCFVGPPGVGKTSIGRSIANALNRKFYRVSLGGLDDVAELKGHRRTYIGALPGKIVHAFKLAETENPVILIDEIDKIGLRSYQGSPENVLLEVLDPEQNIALNDYYLDAPIDLSKVLFLCTANWEENISKPLYDRMDIIQVPGYTETEKMEILNQYLQPEAKRKAGLEVHSDYIDEDTKEVIIRDYCREAGVRSLQKYTTRIYEKLAKQVVQGTQVKNLRPEDLLHFIGHSIFNKERLYDVTPPGIIMGLAYTETGGSVLFIEACKIKDSEKAALRITGNVQKVMEESIQIAYTYARQLCQRLRLETLERQEIHLHVPEGAIPKDGPSAGVTITTALLSYAMDRPAIQNLAMTGEISLTGKVLRIGGLKEKLVAAKREGIVELCLPHTNRDTFQELSEHVKEGFNVHFVSEFEHVFRVAFPDVPL